ncbi:RNA polymerase I-specific transcription initiation factor RRN3 [Laetiporus sulphureus 93-53]|uniref:RNA polymerase I-specific transcription initiation factor RRN3 n=1 Tax=Laetiporus sulphureus 93-53 TaxID=1314785 RepID=A0A165DUA2_9APHY|nr:RNA polymerase I-specific transcription initiation factor RRN3 [Laetiporus sulphureus 93-53]KZT05644.1 RNA polymerase I-specific transcription initiation factor RRN3 [Laetiporus sulphureus 93-53]
MDLHSRFIQCNVRQPKAGPTATSLRHLEPPQMFVFSLEDFKERSASSKQWSSSASELALDVSRPIATNSRIKQDEQYRKDMYLAFVRNALQQKTNGISDAFDELVDQFNPKKPHDETSLPPSQLRHWIFALSHVVSQLDRCHSLLVEAVLSVPWATMDTSFAKSYTSFIGMLISARPEYLSSVLGKIARSFTHQSGLDSSLPSSSTTPLTHRVVYDRIHYLLQHLLSLVPTLPSTLHPLLVRNFPHKSHSVVSQVTYIKNILKITEYCPELAESILALIVDRATQIDVEIQVELEELEEHLVDQAQEEIFELDPFDTLVGQEGEESESDDDDYEDRDNLSDLSSEGGGDTDDKAQDDVPINYHHIQGMVSKLDAIMKNIFDHFSRTHAETSPVSISAPSSPSSSSHTPSSPAPEFRPPSAAILEEGRIFRRQQFHVLLSIFDRTILRTFKSRYTQFLVFWYSSLDPEFSDLFQGMLVSKSLLEEDQPAVTRAAAASYIASFVSRAQFVDRDSTRRVVACLCNFLQNRLDTLEAVTRAGAVPPSMAHHSVFYAVAQAVFLIFCFRWRDLLEYQEDIDEFTSVGAPPKQWMMELNIIQRVVTSELNPLKVCSQTVVMQFAQIAHATDFIYCYSIMEANRRSEYASQQPASNNAATGSRWASTIHPSLLEHSMTSELDSFFPFDPYKLPGSSSYIRGVYREWSSIAIDNEDEDEIDNEDEMGMEEAEDGIEEHEPQGIPVTGAKSADVDDAADGLGESFGGMSISPLGPALVVA